MNPADLPAVSRRQGNKAFKRLGIWWEGLSNDTAFQDDDVYADQEAPSSDKRGRPAQQPLDTGSEQAGGHAVGRVSSTKAGGLRRSSTLSRQKSKTAVLSNSAADKFLGTAATATGRRERLPPFIIHPLDIRYRVWWYTTVLIAAITAILEPYVIAFTQPGLFPYASASSIMEYVCMVVVGIDMIISFNVARYHNGELVVDRRQLARAYLRLIFWVDLLSVIPFDEVALAIAGLNGPRYVNNPLLAQYLSLLKLVRMLRMYRLSWFFSYLTYNLAAPLLLVTLSRNIFATFFLANFSACAFYFEAMQAGFGPNTWVGANQAMLGGADSAQMYTWSLYWSVITLGTVGYGDLHAYNPVEAGLISFWVIFIFFYSAYIIGSVTLLVVKGDERMGQYREQMRALQHYSALNDLPEDLRESMLRHLKLHFYNSQSADEHVLRAYPSTIRRRVLRQLYLPALRSVYLFSGAKQRFMDALLAVARVELYLPQVEVLGESDFVNELFIVVAGELACTRSPLAGSSGADDDVVLGDSNSSVRGGKTRLLQEGDVFGEIAFFTGTAQTERVTTLSTVRVLAISKSAYEQIAQTFRDSARSVLAQLAQEAEHCTQAEFPGIRGHQLYREVMGSDLMRQSLSGELARRSVAADVAGTSAVQSLTGGDPTWRLPPGTAAALRLTAHQEAAVGNLLRVQAVVSQYVAKHDEDRVMEWLYAASRGDNGKIREMLDHGFDPDSADYDARCGLMLAANKGYRETVALLLEVGADPNATDAFGGTALWEACKGRHEECIDLLRQKGGRLGKEGVSEAALLCTAVFEGDLKLLRLLLRAGAHVDAGDYDKRTALHIAAAEGNLAAVEMLVNVGGADMFVRDRWKATPADEAQRVGSATVSAFLQQAQQAAGKQPQHVTQDG